MNTKRIAVVLLTLMAFPCWAAMEVNLPPPTECEAPLGAPTAPGDAYDVTFTGATTANAPAISGWHRVALPDETFTLTGIRFTRRTASRPWIGHTKATIGTIATRP
jgi:hypothetical protein